MVDVAVTCGAVTGTVPAGNTVFDADPLRVTGSPFCCGVIGPVTVCGCVSANVVAEVFGTTELSIAATSLDEPVLQEVNMIPIRPTADKILFIKIHVFKYPELSNEA